MNLSSGHFLAGLLLCFEMANAQGGTPASRAVYIEVCVTEQKVELVSEGVDEALTKRIIGLPGVAEYYSMITHGQVYIEVQFKGGATDDDQATISAALKDIAFNPELGFQSLSVRLDARREDGMFPRSQGCAAQGRKD